MTSRLRSSRRFGARLGRAMLGAMLGAALVAAGSCGGEERGGVAGGEAASTQVAALDYEVTPERYDRWAAAQRALDAIPGLAPPPPIDPARLDEGEIRRAVEYLERDPRARAALTRAGISARDYVLTTVALDQALVATEASGSAARGHAAAGGPSPGALAPGSATAGAPTSTSRPAGASPRPAATSGTRSPPTRAAPAPAQPRFAGVPQRNIDLVQRRRQDVVRVLRTMRFRISKPVADDLVEGDTTITRSDSVAVGKDITVKWDVTVRRNRDTTGARRSTRAAPDSTRRSSSPPDSVPPG